MATSVMSSSEADLSSVADMEEEPLGELTDEELHNLLQETVYEIVITKFQVYPFPFLGCTTSWHSPAQI